MTKHVHEWIFHIEDDGVWWFYCKCGAILTREEAEARLNATERLSAEDARANILQIESCEFECQAGPIELNTGYIRLRDDLQAYVDILEGKDD